MATYQEDMDRQSAGIPLFKDKRTKNGWILNIVKPNDKLLSTSLYEASGKLVENKVFMIQVDKDIEIFRKYLELFEEDPQKNVKAMSRLLRLKIEDTKDLEHGI